MKAITLLLLAAFLSTESFAAPASVSAAAATATTIMPGSSHDAIFGAGASKRRKRKKSRPAYRRIGSYPAPAARPMTA